MWALVVFLYVQSNLDVEISVRIDQFYSEPTCAGREVPDTKPLPLRPGDAARWQQASCIKVRS